MMPSDIERVRDCLLEWDEEEDGSMTDCMQGAELGFLAERLDEEDLLPLMTEIFDTVLGECDEACVTVKKMQAEVSKMCAAA